MRIVVSGYTALPPVFWNKKPLSSAKVQGAFAYSNRCHARVYAVHCCHQTSTTSCTQINVYTQPTVCFSRKPAQHELPPRGRQVRCLTALIST